jgi:hypothetical protein
MCPCPARAGVFFVPVIGLIGLTADISKTQTRQEREEDAKEIF